MSEKIPKIEESTKFNLITSIWIVPVVALIIALWLAWQYYAKLGPQIRITFPKNEGLRAGQSQIKYKDVPIGKVTRIELSDDGKGVIVYARMEKMASEYLNETTKFWIVKPEVGVTGVSGLETLLSGTYIDMYAQKGSQSKEAFHGLAHPFRQNTEGEYVMLRAPQAYNVIKGTPLYFRDIEVGEVESVAIDHHGESVEFAVFVNQAYLPFIHKDSKFWVMSTLDVDISSGGIDVNLAPFTHLIRSGIAFSSSGIDSNDTVPKNFTFYLYKNALCANENRIGKERESIKTYRIVTEDPIAKLTVDAPVRFFGYDVGRVRASQIGYESERHKVKAEVWLDIDTSAFADKKSGEANLQRAVKEGLRARIAPIDPITGRLFVDLVFVDTNQTAQIEKRGGYLTLPTVPMAQSSIMDGVERIVAKINALPLDEMIASITALSKDSDTAVKALQGILADLKESARAIHTMTDKASFAAMPDETQKALGTLTQTLKRAQKVLKNYDGNSLLSHQISQTLRSVNESSRQMQQFLRMLNRKPNSLIFGDK